MSTTQQPRRPKAPEAPEPTPEPEAAPVATDDDAAKKAAREASKKAHREAVEHLTALASQDTLAGRQIRRAVTLEQQHAATLEAIGKSRVFLRMMADNEELSEAEANWLATFHPRKEKDERRSRDEVEATAKAHAVAQDVKLEAVEESAA